MVNRGLLPEIPKIAKKIMALRRAIQKDNIQEVDLKLAKVQKALKVA
jgi:hypothetical protein